MLFVPGSEMDQPKTQGLLDSVSQLGCLFFPLLPLALPFSVNFSKKLSSNSSYAFLFWKVSSAFGVPPEADKY